MELTTVTESTAVLHGGVDVRRLSGLQPGQTVTIDGIEATTLVPPPGQRLSTFTTVNDVHFGETVCGVIDNDYTHAIRPAEGEPPYPETMNAGAVAEMAAINPSVVLVKGDLTADGTADQYERFLQVYEGAFGDRLVHVRGNHESYSSSPFARFPLQRTDVAGATLVLLDTSRDGFANGDLTDEQLDEVESIASDAATPVLLFGHHHIWRPAKDARDDRYFGLIPTASERLIAAVARHSNIRGYFAGHTHRNRVVHIPECGDVPFVEVGCVKDYPGSWAEYRIFEGGFMQIHHRISTPDALGWSSRAREMFDGLYGGYALGPIQHRCFSLTW